MSRPPDPFSCYLLTEELLLRPADLIMSSMKHLTGTKWKSRHLMMNLVFKYGKRKEMQHKVQRQSKAFQYLDFGTENFRELLIAKKNEKRKKCQSSNNRVGEGETFRATNCNVNDRLEKCSNYLRDYDKPG